MSRAKESHTILIVDDEERQRKALEKSLSQGNCQTVSAASGEEALAVLEEKRIDLVITDLVMPGMDGMALLRNVKHKFPSMKSIIITAYDSPESMEEAEALGVACYLAKPFDLSHLKSKVNELLLAGEALEETAELPCGESDGGREARALHAFCSGAGKALGAITCVSRKALHGLEPKNVITSAGRATQAVSGVCAGIQQFASGLVSKKREVNGQ